MRRLAMFAIAAVTSTVAQSASAADIPVRRPVVTAPVSIVYNWSGWYAGGNFGYGWGHDNSAGLAPSADPASIAFWTPAFAAGAAPSGFGLRPEGWLGGGQVGFNWQADRIVYGLEADIQGADINDTVNIATAGIVGFVPGFFSASQKLTVFGTVRGRIGWAPDRWLIYATGGLAYGRTDYGLNFAFPGTLDFQTISASDWRIGWTAGAGIEWAAWENITFKIEYLHIDLEDATFASVPSGRPANLVTSLTGTFTNRYDIVRAGFNYRFAIR